MIAPPILILHATGTNRDRDAAWACALAGGAPEIVHVNRVLAGEVHLAGYRMLVIPGGFSYGDDLGAGKLWAVGLRHRLADDLAAFVAAGRPVLGICNGFQVLVKSGLLPGPGFPADSTGRNGPGMTVTLTRNDSARFECRWVTLEPNPDSPCIFTRGLSEPIHCPVAHGEGKFVAASPEVLAGLEAAHLPALRYGAPRSSGHAGLAGKGDYPWNPNGSQNAIAGICNPAGNVLGLMPHPEDHILPEQAPGYHRGERGASGLPLFANGVHYAAQL